MDRFRLIQPLIVPHLPQGFLDHEKPETEGVEPSRSKGHTRRHHAAAEWEAIRPDLTELLVSHELKDAVEIIKRTHSFEAGYATT